MNRKMLQPKKSHRIRNFFLIVAMLLLVIIVIGSLQQAKHSTAPSQTVTSSQTTTQPSPAPTTTSPEPSPAPVAAIEHKISITPFVLDDSKVKVDITTNIPGEIEVVADLTLAGQGPNDIVIGTQAKHVVIHNGEGQTILDGSKLPTGKYDVEVTLYPRWGLKDAVSKSCGIKQDFDYSIGRTATVILTGTGESAEAVVKRNQGQRWVESNVFGGTKWDPGFWINKFGPWQELKVTCYNPQIIKGFYFRSIKMTLMVNILKGEIDTWRMGKDNFDGDCKSSTPAPTPQPNETPESPASPKREKVPEIRGIKASISFTGTQFVITNKEDHDWVNVRFELNPGLISSGYTLKIQVIKAGTTYTVGAIQFANVKGERFNPFLMKPKEFHIIDYYSAWPEQAGMEGLAIFSWQ